MSGKSPGERAIEAFEIQDVFLVRSECWVARDFNQSAPIGEFTFGQQSGVEPEGLAQERAPTNGGAQFLIFRYYVNAEVRILKQGVDAREREPVEEDFLAVMKFTLAADYRCRKEALEDKDAVGAFSRNAHFHAWPYLREEVATTCSRMRLPRITLQMLKPEQAGKATVRPEERSSETPPSHA